VRWCIEPGESRLFGAERGCGEFEQRLLRFDGPEGTRTNDAEDEVLYVLAGHGRATVGSGNATGPEQQTGGGVTPASACGRG